MGISSIIDIYAFGRRFYPKRLELHFRYTHFYILISSCLPANIDLSSKKAILLLVRSLRDGFSAHILKPRHKQLASITKVIFRGLYRFNGEKTCEIVSKFQSWLVNS